MRQAYRAKPHREAEEVLLGQVQEPVAFKAPVPTELDEHESCGVSAVRERIPGKPGVTETEEVLQPRLRKPGEGEEAGDGEGRGYGWMRMSWMKP